MIRIMECSICSKTSKENLVLLGRNICSRCEAEMVRSGVGDSSYPLYREKIKNILKAGGDPAAMYEV